MAYVHAPAWLGAAGGLVFGAMTTAVAVGVRRVWLSSAAVVGAIAGLGYVVGVLLLRWTAGLWG